MYRTKTGNATSAKRRNRRTVFRVRGPHMHRDRIRAAVGATASVIGILLVSPRLEHPRSSEQQVGHGFTDAERREESP